MDIRSFFKSPSGAPAASKAKDAAPAASKAAKDAGASASKAANDAPQSAVASAPAPKSPTTVRRSLPPGPPKDSPQESACLLFRMDLAALVSLSIGRLPRSKTEARSSTPSSSTDASPRKSERSPAVTKPTISPENASPVKSKYFGGTESKADHGKGEAAPAQGERNAREPTKRDALADVRSPTSPLKKQKTDPIARPASSASQPKMTITKVEPAPQPSSAKTVLTAAHSTPRHTRRRSLHPRTRART